MSPFFSFVCVLQTSCVAAILFFCSNLGGAGLYILRPTSPRLSLICATTLCLLKQILNSLHVVQHEIPGGWETREATTSNELPNDKDSGGSETTKLSGNG